MARPPRSRTGASRVLGRGSVTIAVMMLGALPLALGARAGQAATCFGERATIVADRYLVKGTAERDVIVDSVGPGLIVAGRGNDLVGVDSGGFHEVEGGAGADRIAGGQGEDHLGGDRGHDIVIGRGGPDSIVDLAARGDDRYRGRGGRDLIGFSFAGHRRAESVRVDLRAGIARGHGNDRLAGFEAVEGTGRADVLRGDGKGNALDGVRGGDVIAGRAGDDAILGADVPSQIPSGAGRGNDPALRGGPGDDTIHGRAGSDRLFGGPGADLLNGGAVDGAGTPRDRDRGDGGAGVDRCAQIERPKRCEA
jgi:Ca2+-binding RTX toxin-like protein